MFLHRNNALTSLFTEAKWQCCHWECFLCKISPAIQQLLTRFTLAEGSGWGLGGCLSGFGWADATGEALLALQSPLPLTAFFLDLAVFLVWKETKQPQASKLSAQICFLRDERVDRDKYRPSRSEQIEKKSHLIVMFMCKIINFIEMNHSWEGGLLSVTPTLSWPQGTLQFVFWCRAAAEWVWHQACPQVSYKACSWSNRPAEDRIYWASEAAEDKTRGTMSWVTEVTYFSLHISGWWNNDSSENNMLCRNQVLKSWTSWLKLVVLSLKMSLNSANMLTKRSTKLSFRNLTRLYIYFMYTRRVKQTPLVEN